MALATFVTVAIVAGAAEVEAALLLAGKGDPDPNDNVRGDPAYGPTGKKLTFTPSGPTAGAPISLSGAKSGVKMSYNLSHTLDNYNEQSKDAMVIYKHAKHVLKLDSSIPVSHAPLITLKTFQTDWQSKRARPNPLDNYFLRPLLTWDVFGWDGMFMRNLATIDSATVPATITTTESFLQFHLARDGQGRLWVPEILAAKYFEGTGGTAVTYVALQPMWDVVSTAAHQSTQPGGVENPRVQAGFGMIGAVGWNPADNVSPVVDLRDNHGRGVIWPLQYMMIASSAAVASSALVIYRYAPIEYDALAYVCKKYVDLSAAKATDSTPRTIHGLQPTIAYYKWWQTYFDSGNLIDFSDGADNFTAPIINMN